MLLTMDRLNQILDDIASRRSQPTTLAQLASVTGHPTTLIRIRAEERGLVVERNIVQPAMPEADR